MPSLAQSAFVDENDREPLFFGFFNLRSAFSLPLGNGFFVAFQSSSGRALATPAELPQ
jgi:hypothetical protein